MKRSFLKAASLLTLVSLIALASCIKPKTAAPNGPIAGEKPEEEELETDVNKLKFLTFSISPSANDRIYSELTLKTDGNTLSGDILYYQADLSRLKATFTTNGAKVTVADTEQTSAATANDFRKTVTYRIWTKNGEHKDFQVVVRNPEESYSGLPVVVINTEKNAPVVSKENWVAGSLKIDKQKESWTELSGKIEIKGRGNNTWTKDKKPYAIKLAEKQPVMGMPAQKRWVLLANQEDKTLLRNRTAFEIAKRTGLAWTSDSRYVDVILNGKFLGNYLLCEQIRVDKNRVNIAEMDPAMASEPDITGGYLLELDRYYDEINKFRPTLSQLPVNIKEPDEETLNATQKAYIENYFNSVETLLYASGFPGTGAYQNLIDIDSYIDWWIVHELTHNRDSRLPGSCYMHKNREGKLTAGPVWDFDLATFIKSTGFLLTEQDGDNNSWFPELFKDPAFKQRAKERWTQFKQDFATIPAFIDAEAAHITKAAGINWDMWEYDIIKADMNHDEKLPWEEAVSEMKKNYLDRLNWMDSRISAW